MASALNRSRQHTLMFRTGARVTSRTDLSLLSDVTFQQIMLFIIDHSCLLRAKLANARPTSITSSTEPSSWVTGFLAITFFVIFIQRNHSSTDQRDRSVKCIFIL